jgi:hypothetical protein
MPGPPCHVAYASGQNEIIAGCRAACWPRTRPLHLLTVYCYVRVNTAPGYLRERFLYPPCYVRLITVWSGVRERFLYSPSMSD